MNLSVFAIMSFLMIGIQSSPIDTSLQYLQRFGYINNLFRSRNKEHDLKSALLRFQDFHGLDKTGELDKETLDLMSKPRCGLPDVDSSSQTSPVRVRRQSSRNKWNRKYLTYFVGSYPTELVTQKEEVNLQISQAFKTWSDVSGLTFGIAPSYERADIQIDFMEGNHGDGYDFDGPSGVLAHAFFPGSGGDIHFDDAETWELQRPRRANRPYKQLYQIAVHEIGHSLGLQHSRDKRAIMTPVYRGWIPNMKLSHDDIQEIQRRYGPRKKSKEVVKENEVQPDNSRVHFGK